MAKAKEDQQTGERLHTVKYVSTALGLAIPTIYKLIQSDHLKAMRLPGTDRLVVAQADLEDYLARARGGACH